MRKYIIYKIVGLALLVAAIAACDTATQEVEPVISPDDYPMVTFTSDLAGTEVMEGDTVVYTITFDKMLNRSVTFHMTQTGGDAEEHHDWDEIAAVVQPFSLEAKLYVVFYADDVPETGTLSFQGEIGATSLADKYLVNPAVQNPSVDWTVKNYNDPTLLSMEIGWDNDEDYDWLTWSDTDDYPYTWWGGTGAFTGSNPEYDYSIWLADPPGKYWLSLWDWGGMGLFNYTITLGYPDQNVEVITGTYDPAASYIMDSSDVLAAYGYPKYPTYRILDITVSPTEITVVPY